MFTSDLLLGLQLWLVTFIFGIVSQPISLKIFPNIFDRGYFVGKLLGLFAVSYLLFLAATLKILPLGFNSIVIILVFWSVINFFVWHRSKYQSIPLKPIFFTEVLFLILISFFIYIKGHQPEIYQIERFMDFGFIKALTQSQYLPLEDIWRAGKPLNYYYFGHFLAYVLMSLSKISIVPGFFLVQCWIFATSGVVAFIVGSSIVKNWKVSLKWSVFAGLLSLFATIFAGDWHSVVWFINSQLSVSSSSFWYPEPTRMIPGTISELPIYSFIVADLHAHVWGFLMGVVTILVLVQIWFAKENIKKLIFLLSFLLGLMIMTNTWDFLTLGSIIFAALILKLKPLTNRAQILTIILCFAGGILFSTPWFLFFKSPLGGIGLVTKWSPPLPWLLFWGPSIFLILLYFLIKIKNKLNFEKEGLIAILFFASLFWLAFLEVFYVKDILSGGEWFRANTYFKVSLQILLWVGLVTGPTLFLILTKAKKSTKLLLSLIFALWLLSRAVYPIKAIYQASLENKKYTGISSGMSFWQSRYPQDYQAFKFLEKQPKGVILEADGDSYQDTSFFSTFLGWPTVTGWPVHEWTWQGTYDDVGKRAGEVKEIYTGTDLQKAREILKKYKVAYIIISTAETKKYSSSLNQERLHQLGEIIYQSPGLEIKIFKVFN